MGTPKLSSVRQGPSSNHQHHEGFHLPLPRGRRHGRGRSPVPLRQLLPQHLRLRRQLLPLRQARGRGRPRPDLQQRLPLPHCLQRTFPRSLQHPLHHPLRLRRHPPPRQEGGRGRPRSRLQQRLPLPLCLQRNLQHPLHHPLHLRPPPPLHLRLWPPQLRLQRSLQPRHLQRNPHLRQ